jgi:hypothetical protein
MVLTILLVVLLALILTAVSADDFCEGLLWLLRIILFQNPSRAEKRAASDAQRLHVLAMRRERASH